MDMQTPVGHFAGHSRLGWFLGGTAAPEPIYDPSLHVSLRCLVSSSSSLDGNSMDLGEPARSLSFQAYFNWWVICWSAREPNGILGNQGSNQFSAIGMKHISIKQNNKSLGMLPKLKSQPWNNPQNLAEFHSESFTPSLEGSKQPPAAPLLCVRSFNYCFFFLFFNFNCDVPELLAGYRQVTGAGLRTPTWASMSGRTSWFGTFKNNLPSLTLWFTCPR